MRRKEVKKLNKYGKRKLLLYLRQTTKLKRYLMIAAIEKNLHRIIQLLTVISDDDYNNTSVPPYYSSIGGHVRHILDVFSCIFEGVPTAEINLINRNRDKAVELQTLKGIKYCESILLKLSAMQSEDFGKIVSVSDNLGLGVVVQDYTLGSLLIQAHSHAVHHFASLGYIITQLGLELPDEDFGFNPTTPKVKLSKA